MGLLLVVTGPDIDFHLVPLTLAGSFGKSMLGGVTLQQVAVTSCSLAHDPLMA